MEVETPYAVPAPGEEVHLRTFRTARERSTGGCEPLWLHTSPEFAMKRLLVAGAGPVFQLARVWRNGEGSDTHAPEFTMLEWYRPGASLADLMDETEAVLHAADDPVGVGQQLPRRGARFGGERETVPARGADAAVAGAPAEPGGLHQPRGAELDQPLARRPGRAALDRPRGGDDGVGEEGPSAAAVRIGRVEHHALAGPFPQLPSQPVGKRRAHPGSKLRQRGLDPGAGVQLSLQLARHPGKPEHAEGTGSH